jgi:threonine dehydratase
MSEIPSFQDVLDAAARIGGLVHRTPILTSSSLDRDLGANLFFKCEGFQKTGAFKARGALNAVLQLPREAKGVLTHSSGNHGAALAWAASCRSLPARIVVPENASPFKRDAVARYGGMITVCGPTLDSRETTAARLLDDTGYSLIPPYDHAHIVAGQGTAALELLQDIPDLDLLVTPVGGGGLLAGSLLAANGLDKKPLVLGAEPAGADDAFRSLAAGHIVPCQNPQTIADGLRTSLGRIPFAIIKELADGIELAPEPTIAPAMRRLWERLKILVEPSSAVPLAAIMSGAIPVAGQRVGVILSGANVALDHLPWTGS